MENENKLLSIQFLISECQDAIKYIETKATISITVIAGFIVALYDKSEFIINNFSQFNLATYFLLSLLVFSIILSLTILILIISPIQNPTKSIHEVEENIELIKIYFPKNKYENKVLSLFKVNTENESLNYSFSKFIKNTKSEEKIFINSFSFELLKLSFIRNIKKDRLSLLIKIIIFTSIIFIVTLTKLIIIKEIIEKQAENKIVAIR